MEQDLRGLQGEVPRGVQAVKSPSLAIHSIWTEIAIRLALLLCVVWSLSGAHGIAPRAEGAPLGRRRTPFIFWRRSCYSHG